MKSFTKISIALALTTGLASVAVAGDAKGGDAKKMEMPKPPAEITELSKTISGNWKCTGKMWMDPSKPDQSMDMKMTMKLAPDMANFWVKGTMDAGAMFKGEIMFAYDTAQKKFVNIVRDSMGAYEMKWSPGMKDNKLVWEGEAYMPAGMGGPGGKVKVRETNDMTDMKAGLKLMGEYQFDGKTYAKAWEATCKK